MGYTHIPFFSLFILIDMPGIISFDLDKLKILTESLPAIPKLADFKKINVSDPTSSIYNVEGGTAISYNLLTLPEVCVARTFVSSGSKFPTHNHFEKELLIIYSGSMMMTVGDRKLIMKEGDCIKLDTEVPHSARALEDTWFIAVSVPYSKDFP